MAGNPFEDFIQTELPKRPWLPADVPQETIMVRRGLGPRQLQAVQLQEGEVLGLVDGELKGIVPNTGPTIDAVTHVQSFTSYTWTINHNRNNQNVQVSLYDVNGNQFDPDTIKIADNRVTVTLAEPAMGRAILIFAPATAPVSFTPVETTDSIAGVVVEPVVTPNQSAPAQAVKPDGNLLDGTGNPPGSLVIASNGHLDLALGARIRQVATLPPADENGHYNVEIGSTRLWTFVYSASLNSVEFGSVLTNFYDITLKVEDTDHVGESINLDMTRIGNAYLNIDETNNIRITDGTYLADLSVFQDIQSVSFYGTAFPSATRNAAGGLLGNFRLTYTATPKAGVAGDPVVCTITATITGVPVT